MAVTYEVPLSYTINVSLSSTLSGLADFNTNSIAIFTNEKAGFSESYKAYITPSAIESDFSTGSLTALMGSALYTPVPNFRTGGGYLYIFPFDGVDATAGTLETVALSANIANIQSITNGVLNLTIDGVATQIENLNFTTVQSLADIVTVLQAQNLDVNIEATADNKIKFTSRRYGVDGGVTIATATGSDGTDLYGANYLDGASAVVVAGVNASGQTLAQAVKQAQQQVYFGGVLTTQKLDNDSVIANATAIQSMDCTYYECVTSLKNISVLGQAIKSAGLTKTRLLAYSMGADMAKQAVATYATIAKSVNYSGTDTSNTLNLKTLTGIQPDTGLNDTYVLNAQTYGVDIYANTGGLSVVYSNDNGAYTDEVEANLWLKKAIEVAGFNYLRQTNTKIPQTESGMTGLKNAYTQVCVRGVNNGSFGAGEWNSAIPFGDPEDFAQNITNQGYFIYSIPVSQQPQTDREARKAPVVQIALKRSGAIHFSDVIVNIER